MDMSPVHNALAEHQMCNHVILIYFGREIHLSIYPISMHSICYVQGSGVLEPTLSETGQEVSYNVGHSSVYQRTYTEIYNYADSYL